MQRGPSVWIRVGVERRPRDAHAAARGARRARHDRHDEWRPYRRAIEGHSKQRLARTSRAQAAAVTAIGVIDEIGRHEKVIPRVRARAVLHRHLEAPAAAPAGVAVRVVREQHEGRLRARVNGRKGRAVRHRHARGREHVERRRGRARRTGHHAQRERRAPDALLRRTRAKQHV
jgi:hypothetical protein